MRTHRASPIPAEVHELPWVITEPTAPVPNARLAYDAQTGARSTPVPRAHARGQSAHESGWVALLSTW